MFQAGQETDRGPEPTSGRLEELLPDRLLSAGIPRDELLHLQEGAQALGPPESTWIPPSWRGESIRVRAKTGMATAVNLANACDEERVRKPYSGNLYLRFDEGSGVTPAPTLPIWRSLN